MLKQLQGHLFEAYHLWSMEGDRNFMSLVLRPDLLCEAANDFLKKTEQGGMYFFNVLNQDVRNIEAHGDHLGVQVMEYDQLREWSIPYTAIDHLILDVGIELEDGIGAALPVMMPDIEGYALATRAMAFTANSASFGETKVERVRPKLSIVR